jgi:2-C-methyl-D-erythritol 4-phosphate cytidylyltransferase / 2-C-methyl-D-erythritol 2,4-cyclodiphosphate synthase
MDTSEKTVALLVAAGSGSRTGGDLPKQYRRLGGKSVIAHAIDRLRHPLIDEILVVIGAGQEALYWESVGERALPSPIIGGDTRQQSSRNGLNAIAEAGGAANVLIHDASRPFLPAQLIERLVEALDHSSGAVPTLPVVDSLAQSADALGEPVDRGTLVRVQTPQAFRFEAILDAHRRWQRGADATDDAQVARAAGYDILTLAGDERLSKLTYEGDFMRAEQTLRASMVSRTGLGFDVHAFAEGEQLWLGGLLIPHARGLSGHSDADVLLHALTDALLGAAGEGDIGVHFPPSDPQWRGAASARFVEHARALIEARGGCIDHVDLTLICEAPKLSPHREIIRARLTDLLGLPPGSVSLKATTTERLGFTGRREGIAAQAVATIRLPEE